MSDRDEVLAQAADWLDSGKAVALATVTGTWGSSPRPLGSLLAISEDGAFEGSVSGGCVEGAVVQEALEIIANNTPRLVDYGVSNDQAWEVGLACGGEMKVFIEKIADVQTLRRLLENRPVARAIALDSGTDALIDADGPHGGLSLDADALASIAAAVNADAPTHLDTPSGPVFVNVFNTPLRMILIGAVHIAQNLAPMAAMAGFAVTVVDPRSAFATEARFPGVSLDPAWPDKALEALAPDHRTAVVTLSHDPKLDDPALNVALKSGAYYIGSLGSRKTHASRVERLKAVGFDDAAIARIYSPIGFDLGGRSASEIAVSVLAEAVAARYGKVPGGKGSSSKVSP